MRRLLVMRHGKSDWTVGASDRQRPLNGRGHAAAAAMGRLLSSMGQAPDCVLSSTAVRALTTATVAAEAGSWNARIDATRDLYDTSPQGATEVVAAVSSDVEQLLLVGHEPTSSGLVAHLTGGVVAMKTATVVGIDLLIADWSEALDCQGEIVFVLQSRHFTT